MAKESQISRIRSRERQPSGRRSPRVGLVPRQPTRQEEAYARDLRAYFNVFFESIRDNVIPELEDLQEEVMSARPESRTDQASNDLRGIIRASVSIFVTVAGDPEEFINRAFRRVNRFNLQDNDRIIEEIPDMDLVDQEPWLQDQIESFVSQNTALITNITTDTQTDITGIIERGFNRGSTIPQIRSEILERFDTTRSRANLIARDQVATLNGQLSELRHRELGINRYIWSTVGDERVRASHRSLDGREFSYDNPPEVGNPGQPINCRCVARPIFT